MDFVHAKIALNGIFSFSQVFENQLIFANHAKFRGFSVCAVPVAGLVLGRNWAMRVKRGSAEPDSFTTI
jgi:hypothetical protein